MICGVVYVFARVYVCIVWVLCGYVYCCVDMCMCVL